MSIEADRLALHFKYCAFILVMVIIAVATDRWTAQKDFTTYLSNAATMTSLLLGLVAIFYSFVSNDSLSKSLGSISTVSGEIKDTKDQIGKYVESSKSATTESIENTRLLQRASSDMASTLEQLASTLGLISEQNQSLQGLVTNLPTRIDQLELKFGDVAKALVEKPSQFQPNVAGTDANALSVETFLARPSLYYNLLAYACVLAGRTQKVLAIDDVCNAVSINAPSYMGGFVYCMYAVRMLQRKAVDGEPRKFQISKVNPELDKIAKKYIVDYLDRAFVDKPDEKREWETRLTNIEALYEIE